MIIPHPKVFLNGIIFSRGDINRMIPAVAQALRNQMSVALICFDSLALLAKHGRRCQNDTFDPGPCELVIKGISEAAGLITAFNRIIIVKAEFQFQGFYETDDLFVVRSNLDLPENTVF
jgi:hypothetical protein